MMGFDEWFNHQGWMEGYTHHYEGAYEAGTASRQAEIDELQTDVEGLQNDLIKAAEGQMKLFEHNNELQKQINEALTFSATWHKSTGSALALEIIKILKGEIR